MRAVVTFFWTIVLILSCLIIIPHFSLLTIFTVGTFLVFFSFYLIMALFPISIYIFIVLVFISVLLIYSILIGLLFLLNFSILILIIAPSIALAKGISVPWNKIFKCCRFDYSIWLKKCDLKVESCVILSPSFVFKNSVVICFWFLFKPEW